MAKKLPKMLQKKKKAEEEELPEEEEVFQEEPTEEDTSVEEEEPDQEELAKIQAEEREHYLNEGNFRYQMLILATQLVGEVTGMNEKLEKLGSLVEDMLEGEDGEEER